MTAPSHCVLEGAVGVPPRRPDSLCEDMGGLQFQDNAKNPPRPNEHASALDFKQMEMLVQRLCKMMPIIQLEFLANDPVQQPSVFVCANSLATASDTFITRTAVGQYTIALGSGKFPAATRAPFGYCMASYGVLVVVSQSGSNVYVHTTNSSGTHVDPDSMIHVDIYGT